MDLSWISQWAKSRSKKNEFDLDIRNFHTVEKNVLYRGAFPSRRAYAQLQDRPGIKTVIDLVLKSTAQQADMPSGMALLHARFDDKKAPDPLLVDEVYKILTTAHYYPIFIHCGGGRHRTGGIVMMYRIAHQGWTWEAAYAEALDCGFYSEMGHEPWLEFMESLRRYEK